MTTEILFYYESRQNPNGDPGFENQPRLMSDETIMVTDVRIKRTIRDYARDVRGETLFVDYGEGGTPVTADKRAKEIAGSADDVIADLLKKTFDVPLFGALVPIRNEGSSEKITGPLQFGMSRSVNKVQIINPTIVGRFVGKEKAGSAQFSTFGKFYSVEYALIKVQGAINPDNIKKYTQDKAIDAKFKEKREMLHDCLWNGTNKLITRSKYPQRSILYIAVDYDGRIYNDLPGLVKENGRLKGMAKELGADPFDFSGMLKAMAGRKDHVKRIRVRGAEDVAPDVDKLVSSLKQEGLDAEVITG